MIKNSAQLKKAEESLVSIQELLLEYSQRYSGIEFELYSTPLVIEENELLDQIIEYKRLRELPFHEAIASVLKRPVLIDNIGELLSKLRIAAKLSQADMAERLGWEQSNLSRFESENYSSQTVNKIVEYASSLGVWLHISPSLTEEAESIEEETTTVRSRRLELSDMDSTSVDYLEQDKMNILRINDRPVADLEKHDVVSI